METLENREVARLVEGINTEDFIYEIEKKPALWDSGKEEYSNKMERRNAWQHVTAKLIPNFEGKSPSEKTLIVTSIQKKWKSIRTCYARELQKKREERSGSGAKGRKQYVYFECLRFLESLCKVTTSSMDQGDENSRVDNEVEETSGLNVRAEEQQERSKQARRSKRKSGKEVDDLIEILRRRTAIEMEEENDEDRQFLLSLVSEMRKVPPEKKLKLKSDIIMAIAGAQKQFVGMQTREFPCYSGSQRNILQQGQYIYVQQAGLPENLASPAPSDDDVVEYELV